MKNFPGKIKFSISKISSCKLIHDSGVTSFNVVLGEKMMTRIILIALITLVFFKQSLAATVNVEPDDFVVGTDIRNASLINMLYTAMQVVSCHP